MPLERKTAKKDETLWDNGISRAMRADEDHGHALETWNTCPNCGAKWKDTVRTEGIMHRSRICGSCVFEGKIE